MLTNEEATKLADIDSRCKSNTHRIDELCRDQRAVLSLATSVASMLKTQEYMGEDIKETSGDIKEIKKTLSGLTPLSEHDKVEADLRALQQKPGQRWESVINIVLWTVVGAAITMMISNIL